jgi:hypothetical protein
MQTVQTPPDSAMKPEWSVRTFVHHLLHRLRRVASEVGVTAVTALTRFVPTLSAEVVKLRVRPDTTAHRRNVEAIFITGMLHRLALQRCVLWVGYVVALTM